MTSIAAAVSESLRVLYELERTASRAFLTCACVHLVVSVISATRKRPTAPAGPSVWPLVTVCLPVRNEADMIERLVTGACALDYPRDRLEIQVLDDSDDHTSAIIDAVVAREAKSGVSIRTLRRGTREGFKAGNLAHGLAESRGELIAVLDADSIPPADLLKRLVPYLTADDGLGMVQARWTYANEEQNVLTRAQALVIDALMATEQRAQAARRLPFQFNGSGGVFRRTCLEQIGGWASATIAEDFDVSVRATLHGWRFEHVDDTTLGTELPATMGAFRKQQHRWLAGKAQVLRARFRQILFGRVALRVKISLLAHVIGRLISPLLAVMTFTAPATIVFGMRTLVHHTHREDFVFSGAVLGVVSLYYVAASRRVGRSLPRAIAALPFALTLLVGMSFCYTHALVEGLLRKRMPFVQTRAPGSRQRPKSDRLAGVEIAVGLAYFAFTLRTVQRGSLVFALFFAWFGLAYLWVGLGTVVARFARRPVVAIVPATEAAGMIATGHVAASAKTKR